MADEKTVQVLHRPNWHPALNTILGDIIGQEGYVTEYGTIELTGYTHKNQALSRYNYESDINGVTLALSAESGLGFA